MTLLACCVAQMLVVLDSSILTVALPQLAADLGMTPGDLPWAVNAFAIPIAGLLLLGGQLADVFGARRILIVGVCLFALASFGGGIAPTSEVLIASRVVQGAAAALMAPATLALLSQSFPAGPSRSRAFGLWGAAAGSGGAIGVLAGGVLIEWANWRWTLLVNVPVCLGLALVLALGRRSNVIDRKVRQLDPLGALTITTAVAAIVLGISSITSGASGPSPALYFSVGVAALVLFVCVELWWAKRPLLPLRAFAQEGLWAMPLAMLFVGGAMTASFYFLTLHFQIFRGLTPLLTGLSFLVLSVAAFAAAANAHLLVRAVGGSKAAISGTVVMAASLLVISLVADNDTLIGVLVASAGFGAGMGITISTLADLVTGSFPPTSAGVASGVLTTAQQIGNATGLAAIVVVDANAGGLSHSSAFAAAALLAGFASVWLLAIALWPMSRKSANSGQGGRLSGSTAPAERTPAVGDY
ncbi:MFS transporter [Cryobacterium zongtaii]|uniref:MFS transporter n=2 Tax=Cryobacterium zongtaii TaxID=1259217 RepID=A0A2S3ZLC8_9MICO|nr:MFS transporter [Cryobacterium zongtaii]